MSETQNGTEIESLEELSEGDRITVIKDEEYHVENTGTEYKIPDSGWEEDVVVVDGAVYDGVKYGFGGIDNYQLSDCPSNVQAEAADLLDKWVDRDNTTVIRHND